VTSVGLSLFSYPNVFTFSVFGQPHVTYGISTHKLTNFRRQAFIKFVVRTKCV
jgi:hypothetical protein